MTGQDQYGQTTVDSVASLVEASRSVFQGFGKTVCWFRGQPSASWGLVPSVHRSYDQVGEHSLAAHFRLSAPTRHLKTPDLSDLPSWISLMQHFGLPTRLLDWTAAPLIALFFALDSEVGTDDAAVWALVPSTLNAASRSQEEIFVLSGETTAARGAGKGAARRPGLGRYRPGYRLENDCPARCVYSARHTSRA